MSKNRDRAEIVSAPELAKICQVDHKTIHNWVNAGKIPHFRTPGRHLRFRMEDVHGFLESIGIEQ